MPLVEVQSENGVEVVGGGDVVVNVGGKHADIEDDIPAEVHIDDMDTDLNADMNEDTPTRELNNDEVQDKAQVNEEGGYVKQKKKRNSKPR